MRDETELCNVACRRPRLSSLCLRRSASDWSSASLPRGNCAVVVAQQLSARNYPCRPPGVPARQRPSMRRGNSEPTHFGRPRKPKPRGKRFNVPLLPVRKPLGEGERVREVIARLVVGRTLQRPFSRFLPIRQRQVFAPTLGIVACDEFWLGSDDVRMGSDHRVGDRMVRWKRLRVSRDW